MNKTSIGGVILVIVGVVFAGVVFIVHPESSEFILSIETLIIPVATAMILGKPIADIKNGIPDQLSQQTDDIVNKITPTGPINSDQNGGSDNGSAVS